MCDRCVRHGRVCFFLAVWQFANFQSDHLSPSAMPFISIAFFRKVFAHNVITFQPFVFKTERKFVVDGEMNAHLAVEWHRLLTGEPVDVQHFDTEEYRRCDEFGVGRCLKFLDERDFLLMMRGRTSPSIQISKLTMFFCGRGAFQSPRAILGGGEELPRDQGHAPGDGRKIGAGCFGYERIGFGRGAQRGLCKLWLVGATREKEQRREEESEECFHLRGRSGLKWL